MSQRRRPRIWCRPRLEILEARLPPRDILFGIDITVNRSDQPVGTEAEVLVGLRFPGYRSWDDSNDLAHLFTGGVAWEPWRRARGSARPLKPRSGGGAGARIVQQTWAGSPDQLWQLVPAGGE